MKKELSAAVLSAALLTSCSANQSSSTDESATTTISVTTAAITTTAAETKNSTTTAAITTTAAAQTTAEITTLPARKSLHTDLRNITDAADETKAEEDIKRVTLTSLNFYPDKEEHLPYEPTDSEKQLIQDYIISHDLSPVDDGDYCFFYNQERSPDYSQVAFYASVSVPCASGGHLLAFSKDRTVVGVKWQLAEAGSSYYKLEDSEQLQPVFDLAEQYAAGELS